MGSYELETQVRLVGPTGGCGLRETLMECTAKLQSRGHIGLKDERNSRGREEF